MRVKRRNFAIAVMAAMGIALAITAYRSLASGTPSRDDSGDPIASVVSVDASGWDFGVVDPEQALLTHTFQLTNRGATPVEIAPTELGCNCLSVECPQLAGPGETVPIRVEIEIRRREGPFSTRVELGTSDPERPVVELLVAFFGQPRVNIDPPSIRFSGAPRHGVLEEAFEVITRTDAETGTGPVPTVEVAEAHRSAVTVDYLDSQSTAGLLATRGGAGLRRVAHRFMLHVDVEQLPAGEEITLGDVVRASAPSANGDTAASMSVSVSFRRHSRIMGPTQVTLRPGKPARAQLFARGKQAFHVVRVESSPADVTVTAAEGKSADDTRQELTIEVDRPRDSPRTGVTKGRVDVYCSLTPDEPYRIDVLVLP
ncbi:MAG TPA: DUF1573 domain-containing protein [Pirellulales bacterium]|nr:DUF1573 domain-containing protein [Pirellulales bacterium]